MLYFRLSIDLSKQGLEIVDELLLTPLERINEADFLAKLFTGGNNSSTPFGDTLSLDSDLSVGAHLTTMIGFEIAGEEPP